MPSEEPEWVSLAVVLAIHEEQLAEHGGLTGVRDRGLLEAALARPKHILAYTPDPTIRRLAAAYAAGVVRNRPFVDGNKRVGWLLCALFCELNGLSVAASEVEVVRVMLDLAANSMSEDEFTVWLEQPSVAVG